MAKLIAVVKHTQLTWSMAILLGVIPAQLLSSAVLTDPAGGHVVWFSGAVLLGVLLHAPKGAWVACIVGTLGGVLIVTSFFGISFRHAAILSIPALLLTPIAALVLLKLSGDSPPLQGFRAFVAFFVVAVVVLPGLSSAGVCYISRYIEWSSTDQGGWLTNALARSLGIALYIPIWTSVVGAESLWRLHNFNAWLLLKIVLVLTLVYGLWYFFGSVHMMRPLLFLVPIGVIVWAAFTARMVGTSFMVICMTAIAAHLSWNMKGPFPGATPEQTMLGIQLWAWLLTVGATGLAVLIEQRFAARTMLAETHREVRELAGRLIATRENERARLARDLHDDINQQLAAASIQLSMLKRRVVAETRDMVGDIQSQLMSLSEDVRHLSHELHPSMLKQTGLAATLDALCMAQQHSYGPSISLSADEGTDNLPDEVTLCFYRIVQEALANITKHAYAKHVYIRVSIDKVGANLWVIDDGVGFVYEGPRHEIPSGLGLVSMDERVKLLGGSFNVDTSPGKGVDIWIRIPLETRL